MRLGLVATTALLFSDVGNAATIIQYFGAYAGPNYFVPALIDQYSGTGQLSSVAVEYRAGVFVFGQLSPTDLSAPSYQIDILGNVGVTFLNTSEIQEFADSRTYSSEDYYSTPTYAINGYYFASVSDFGLFTGNGQFELLAEGFETATSPSGNYTVLSEKPSTFASGTITYTFGVVPEPSSWAMIVAGTALVGGALRRKRRLSTVLRLPKHHHI